MELDIGKIWVQTLRDAEERGDIPELTEWDAETMSFFLAERGYSIDDLDNAAVAGQLRDYSRKRRRRHWFRWLRLRRNYVRLSDLAAESYGEPDGDLDLAELTATKSEDEKDLPYDEEADNDPVWNEHFAVQEKITKACRKNDYDAALRFCEQTFEFLDRLIEACVRTYGEMDISVDAIRVALEIYAIREDTERLKALQERVYSNPHLSDYRELAEEADLTLENTRGILQTVAENPGIRQNKLKNHVPGGDGRQLALLSRKLDQHGRLRREKVGKTYRLYPVES